MKKFREPPAEPCTACDQVKLTKQLDAEEAVREFQRELVKLEKGHEYDQEKALDAAGTALEKARWDAEAELAKLFHTTIAEIAKGSIDRSRDSAKYVQTAASAIVAIYTGLLALVFSVTDNPLPLRGAYAAVFLGLAIALATAYLAFITRPKPPTLYAGGASLTEMQLYRTGYLTQWVNATVSGRRWAIRASVISLAVGVAFIPAPFIAASRPAKIPDAPVAPAIPAQIAEPVTNDAAALFNAQLEGYKAAADARNQAIEAAATEAKSAADHEDTVNWIASVLAGIALLLVLVGPWIYSKVRRES